MDIGSGKISYEQKIATQVLVVIVTWHTAPWKIPIAYVFTSSLTGQEKANRVRECLLKLD